MHRALIVFAALSGFLSVSLGAFAAHGLKAYLTPDALSIWHTGVNYQMYHALALLVVELFYRNNPSKALKVSGLAFILGTCLFCGSLYALALGAAHAFGIITPLGGLSFLTGWAALVVYGINSR